MRTPRIQLTLVACRVLRGAALVAVLCGLPATEAFAQQARVIVNEDFDRDSVEFSRLQQVFLGNNRRLPGNLRIRTIIVPPDNTPVKRLVLNRIYNMDDKQYAKWWRADPEKTEPRELSAEQALAWVRDNDDAFAIVDGSIDTPGVKTLRIDGLDPGDARYPLQQTFRSKGDSTSP